MNLNELALTSDTPTVLEIVHPVKGIIPGMTISVLGKDSEVFRTELRKVIDKRLRRAAKKGKINGITDSATMATENAELLAKVTTAWTGFKRDEKEIPCTYDEVLALYANPAFAWLLEQVDEGVGERENFFGN